MNNKLFRNNLELSKEKIEQFFPDSNDRLSIEKILRDCSKLASQLNNSNWNVNFDGNFIRFNCGARYVLNINSSRIRVMCLRESFLNLGKEFITEFILTHTLYLEDSSKLLGVKIPRNYEEFIAIPTENLWHNSVQFEIPIDEWTTNYSKILTPSILDFAKDCINQSSIMTQMKTAHSPAIIELINEDLNEELIQPSYPKDEKTQFTWIPFYQEMAKKLLEYKDKRSELIQILYSSLEENNLSSTMYVNNKSNNRTTPLTNIDPFTFIGSFNRGNKWQDRVKLANSVASALQMELRLSDDEDFKSIPILNSQHSTLFFRNCPQEDYDKLWNLFEKAYLYTKENQQDFAAAFDVALTVKGTGQKYATMASYWVNPYKILAVDENNVELLNSYGIKVSNQLTGNDYLEILNKTTSMIESREIKEKSIPEFSYKAWLTKKEDYSDLESRNYWITPGNPNIFDIKGFFQNKIKVDWRQNSNKFQIGDYIFIYVSGDEHAIHYLTKVTKIDLQKLEIDDSDFQVNFDKQDKPPYCELTLLSTYMENDLSFEYLKNNGLNSTLQGAVKIKNMNLVKKLLSYFQEDISMNENVLQQKCISLLKSNHNIILHGAPGTGKTYLAKEIACLMRYNKKYDDLTDEEKKDYDDQKNFVQFHPSYDYTDFVEGLRPVNSEDGNSIGFELRDGVFKEFCEKALENNSFNILNEAIEKFKIECSDEENKLTLKTTTGINFSVTYRGGITFRVRSENSKTEENKDFPVNIDSIKKLYSGNNLMYNISYGRGILNYLKTKYKITEYKKTNNDKPFIFIIDEINRGEMSKIFGELFFSIDPSYRGEKGRVQTQYQNLVDDGEFVKGFYVPENVYIIGTMNDIDRSVESMDFAMRRRFIFKEITAEESADNMNLSEEAKLRMTNLNKAISSIEGLNSSYHIGGAYFLKEIEVDGEQKKVSVESKDFEELWELKLEPLLKEYLRGMEDAVGKLEILKNAYFLNKQSDEA